ncbi:MAG: hypothetical protein EBU46_07700 [Nitrosomonadaceae bacterium]|nr:hypothetical protein [Nitrosomonadaceae bacterium]
MKISCTSSFQGLEPSTLHPWAFFQFSVRVEPNQPEDLAFINAVLVAGLNDEELPYDPRSVTHDKWAVLFDAGHLANFDHNAGPIIRTSTGFRASDALISAFGRCSVVTINEERAEIKFNRCRALYIERTDEEATFEIFEQRVKAMVGKLNKIDVHHKLRP